MLFHAPPVRHLTSSLGNRCLGKLRSCPRPTPSTQSPGSRGPYGKHRPAGQQMLSNFSYAYLPASPPASRLSNGHSRGCLPKTTESGSWLIETSISICCPYRCLRGPTAPQDSTPHCKVVPYVSTKPLLWTFTIPTVIMKKTSHWPL